LRSLRSSHNFKRTMGIKTNALPDRARGEDRMKKKAFPNNQNQPRSISEGMPETRQRGARGGQCVIKKQGNVRGG